MNWTDMSTWDRNGAIALEIIGWRIRIQNTHGIDVVIWIDPGGHDHLEPMRYTTSPSAVILVEDVIDQLGQSDNYIIALSNICNIDLYTRNELPLSASWRLIRATPDQRCEAALRVIRSML